MSITPRILLLTSLALSGCIAVTSTSNLRPSAGDAFNRARSAAKKKKEKARQAQEEKEAAERREAAEAKKAAEAAEAAKASEFVRVDPGDPGGPLGQEYLGRVIFSTEPIPYDGSDGSSIVESHALNGPLHARFWSADSIHNLVEGCISRPTVRTLVSVNDHDPIILVSFLPNPKQHFARAITEELSTSLATPTQVGDRKADKVVQRWNGRIVPLLDEGDNTVRIWLQTSCQGTETVTVAEGSLNVKVTAAARAAYIKKNGPHLPRSSHPDAAVIVRGTKAMLTDRWPKREVLSVTASEKSWNIKRHEVSGVPLYRHTTVVVIDREKDASSDICEAHFVSVRQEAVGSGFGKQINYNAIGIGGPHYVACSTGQR